MRIRCNNATGMALITNDNFRELDWVREMAGKLARDILQTD